MAKSQVLARADNAAPEIAPQTAAASDLQGNVYMVRDGVDWIDGKKLKGRTEIVLTDTEAAYDLAHENIALKRDG